MKIRLALALVLAGATTAAAAAADTPPSRWERARDPEAALAADLHEQVQRRLEALHDEAQGDERDVRAVLPILERAQAATSRSALLRFDYAYVHKALGDYRRAAELYKAALAQFPDHPAAEGAWLELALACGHLGDNPCERAAYTRILQLETEEILHATPTLNLAESQMHLGDLRSAIDGYREVVRLSGRYPVRETGPLAFWGLAVALDRSGDRIEAEKAARLAVELQRSMGTDYLHDPRVTFFVPTYEITWYEALGHVAAARAAPNARTAAVAWALAEASYAKFVRAAEPKNDRWLPIARARLAQVEAERKRAEKAADREPAAPRVGPDGDVPL